MPLSHAARERVRVWISIATAVTMSATLLQVPLGAVARPARAEEPAQARDETAALKAARASDERVEVLSRRTERQQLFANPSGSFTLESSAVPRYVRRSGEWLPADASLKVKGDAVVPAATMVDLAFSGGGTGAPLAKVGLGPNSLSLGWPGTLPAPRLEGEAATYAEVLPGVDLQVRADIEGFSQTLIVKTAEAAQNPQLQRLRFTTDTSGLSIRENAMGNLDVVDGSGTQVFHGSAPMMWDSSTTEPTGGSQSVAPADADEPIDEPIEGPGKGARQADVGVELGQGDLTLVPDQAMLTDPETTFPVIIDPPISMSRAAWAKVSRGFPSQEYPNGGIDGPNGEVGHAGDASEVWRTFYRFNVPSTLHGKQILSSYFHIYETHSWSCETRSVQLWRTGGFSSSTNWSNQPSWVEYLDSVDTAKGYNGCAAGTIKFDAKAAVEDAAAGKWSTLTLGLQAWDEGDNYAWKKFRNNPTVVTEYNSIPQTPSTSEMRLLPGGLCGTWEQPSAVNQLTPKVYAKLRDSDNSVRGRFEIRQDDPVNPDPVVASFTSPMNSTGRDHIWQVTSGLADGKLYRLIVRADDGLAMSAWSANCWFRVDMSDPVGVPTVTQADYPPVATSPDGIEGVGKPGKFTLSANAEADVTGFRYGLDDPDCTKGPAAAGQPGGAATVWATPRAEGMRTLYAAGVDAAGNWGSAGCKPVYYFNAAAGSAAVAHWKFDENSGTSAGDSVDGGRTATLSGGAKWSPGRVNNAVSLNGSTAYAATSSAVVDTSKAFTVSAWVQLSNKNVNYTVLSQSGGRNSGFQLYYSASYDRWIFNRHNTDADGSTISRALGSKAPTTASWTHLIGVYDPGDQQIRLYVNGRLEGWAAFTTPWNATGGLQLGRTKYNGVLSEHFAGQIDDVKVWQRVVSEPAPVPEAYFRLDEADGAAPLDEIYAGRSLTASATGVTQADDCKFNRCLTLNGTTGHATTPAAVVRTDQAFSVGAWVKLTNKNANYSVLSQSGGRNSGFQLYYSVNYDRWIFNRHDTDAAGTGIQRAIGTQSPKAGDWTHLIGVHDPGDQLIRLYVDGRLEASVPFTTPWNATGGLQVGRTKYEGVLSENFAGQIDEVKVWDHVIDFDPYRATEAPHDMLNPADPSTKSEIWHLANRPLQLGAHWKLDETAGTTAADSSDNETTATLSSGAAFGDGSVDGGLALDGVDDQAVTTKNKVVQTDRSFSVAAWLRLNNDAEAWPAGKLGASAVSQDGNVNSGFQLNARKLTDGCQPGESQCYRWTFTTGTADNTSTTTIRASSADTVSQGGWVHLVAVYDMTDRQLRLYVSGELVSTAQVPFTQAWSAEKVLRIGTSRWRNAYTGDFFPGNVDDVQVYAGALTGDDVANVLFGAYPAGYVT